MKVETNPDHVKARAFFRRILSFGSGSEEAVLVVIAHLVDSAVPFIPGLNERFKVQALLGKPSSVQADARNYLSAALPETEYELNRDVFRSDPTTIVREAFPDRSSYSGPAVPVVLLDIGGYFVPKPREDGIEAPMMIRRELASRGYRLAGIVEDTQNGHKRYEEAVERFPYDEFDFPVYSVAHSPLKKPENHLVGVAVTFSIEAILRQSNIVLQSRRAGVIGFGPIGRSVAHALRGRGIAVSICEIDSIQLSQAAAQGFRVYRYEHHFEEFAQDLNLIVSATGAGADAQSGRLPLDPTHVRLLRQDAFVASVTSHDDEIDLVAIEEHYQKRTMTYNPDVERFVIRDPGALQTPHAFNLMLGGNAVNFLHGGVVGPAIQLLQGEVIACVNKILSGEAKGNRSVNELSRAERQVVAEAWLDQYLDESAVHW